MTIFCISDLFLLICILFAVFRNICGDLRIELITVSILITLGYVVLIS